MVITKKMIYINIGMYQKYLYITIEFKQTTSLQFNNIISFEQLTKFHVHAYYHRTRNNKIVE